MVRTLGTRYSGTIKSRDSRDMAKDSARLPQLPTSVDDTLAQLAKGEYREGRAGHAPVLAREFGLRFGQQSGDHRIRDIR